MRMISFARRGVMLAGLVCLAGAVLGQSGRTVLRDLKDVRIEGISAETLVLENCRRVYLGKNDVRRIEVRGGEEVKVEGITMRSPLDRRTVLIEVWNSPGFVAAHNTLEGAGIAVWDSSGAKAVYNTINLVTEGNIHGREGIHFRGCHEFVIGWNKVRGAIHQDREKRSNDLIQVGPSDRPFPALQNPFAWPNRERLIFDPYRGPAATDTIRVHQAAFLTGEHKGKVLTYAVDTSEWPKGGTVVGNELESSGLAGLFLFRVMDVTVRDNMVKNTIDYSLGAEWCRGIRFVDNKVSQDEEWKGVGTGGGIALMHYIEDAMIERNEVERCRIYVRGWGFPVVGVTIRRNTVREGVIHLMYGAAVWHKEIVIVENLVEGGRIEVNSSPFYTTGTIRENEVTGSESSPLGISLEAFDGDVIRNKVVQPARDGQFAFRDFNRGDRMTSRVRFLENTTNGRTARLTVDQPGKAPVSSESLRTQAE